MEAEENEQGEAMPEAGEDDISGLKEALAEEKTRAEEYLANWQRAQADFVNYKRRSEQEREEFGRFANATLMFNLLPSLDDIERALASLPGKLANLTWVDGIRLIERKLRASLEIQGLQAIEALGKAFDPNLHEAVRQDAGKEGIIIEELQKGYQLHDRVIRPTMVVVGNGEAAEKEEN
ncbi:MAG: nucleotide exchange factor GrpE [Dehalococcoidales bacterium]